MREIEVKIKIEDAGKVTELLRGKGYEITSPVIQRDVVYIPDNVPTVPCAAGTNVLRIRYEGERRKLTLKRSDAGNHLSKLEHELEIKDPKEMDAIIRLLGFKVIADTEKTRYKCRAGKYEICVDSVKKLGDFLEIEKMSDEDPAGVQNEMKEFLESLGLSAAETVPYGYDVLYVQKFGNHKN